MKFWDVILVGGGIIGLSLALEMRKRSASVLLIDRSEPGREASWAAAGMIAHCDPNLPEALQPLADASAALYPEFIHEIEDESRMRIDFRREGTIWFGEGDPAPRNAARRIADDTHLAELEPHLSYRPGGWLLPENSVDPRTLVSALIKAARHREIDIVTGSPVVAVELTDARATRVHTEKAHYAATSIVNCAGAWSSQVLPLGFPTRPVKGHMLSVVFQHRAVGFEPPPDPLLQHIVRAPGIYIVPRSDGKLIIGSTIEDCGFDKRVDTETIQRLHQSAANLVPEIGEGRIHEAWTGLRPGTPDGLPILGATGVPGYFAATGHYRDGIMLAPITAKLMADVITGATPAFDLLAFSPQRF